MHLLYDHCTDMKYSRVMGVVTHEKQFALQSLNMYSGNSVSTVHQSCLILSSNAMILTLSGFLEEQE